MANIVNALLLISIFCIAQGVGAHKSPQTVSKREGDDDFNWFAYLKSWYSYGDDDDGYDGDESDGCASSHCDVNADCVSTYGDDDDNDDDDGSSTCTCRPGFTGDGFTCTIIGVCGPIEDDLLCNENQDCVATYQCVCKPGFTGENCEEECLEITTPTPEITTPTPEITTQAG